MKRLALLLGLAATLVAAAAYATVPSTMSYQGVLTDNNGAVQPDGLYNFVFKIYNVGSGGSALWTETDNSVTLTKGSFTVLLGNANPLALPFDVPYYLGISVNGQPELTPRVPLAASAYGLALRLPFAGTETSSGAVFSIKNGGSGPDILADHTLQVGTAAGSGLVELLGGGSGGSFANLYTNSLGGNLDWYDEQGNVTGAFEADANGEGGFFMLWSTAAGFFGPGGLTIDGNFNGSGSPLLRFYGSGSEVDLNGGASGDNAVVLPTDAIDANEILDEPGIAQGHNNNTLVTINSTPTDLVSVTITTPAAGYVVVEADGQHSIVGDGVNANFAFLYITESSGGARDASHYFNSGWVSAGPAGLTDRRPVSIRRTFFKGAGTWTFYFEGTSTNPGGNANYIFDGTITATYYPTSYGPVTVLAQSAEAAGFSRVQSVVSAQSSQPQSGVLVDLSELERRVADERARLAESERALVRARVAAQAQRAANSRMVPRKP